MHYTLEGFLALLNVISHKKKFPRVVALKVRYVEKWPNHCVHVIAV